MFVPDWPTQPDWLALPLFLNEKILNLPLFFVSSDFHYPLNNTKQKLIAEQAV